MRCLSPSHSSVNFLASLMPLDHTRPRRARLAALAWVLALSGCQDMPAEAPSIKAPSAWEESMATDAASSAHGSAPNTTWWRLLRDPAVDALVDATLADNPDLAQALARIDAAAADVGIAQAARRPQLSGTLGINRGSNQVSSDSAQTQVGSIGSASLGFSWEIDLFGRLHAQQAAAEQRLLARGADAAGVRTTLIAQVASQVVEWRSCAYLLRVQQWEVDSLQQTLHLTRRRLSMGAATALDESRALNDVEIAKVDAQVLRESCARAVHAVVALSGLPPDRVRAELAAPLWHGVDACALDEPDSRCDDVRHLPTEAVLPRAPAVSIDIPATVLAGNPAVLSAQREIDAARADLDAARASRYPRLDLSSLLTGQWIALAGKALHVTTWAAGAAFSAPLYDGGSGRSQIDGADARYRQAVAKGVSAVRAAIQGVEDALVALDAAGKRAAASERAVAAARTTLHIAQRQWEEGAASLLGLEDARRQFAIAARSAVTAEKDSAQAWIALVRSTGNNAITFASEHQDD